MATIRQHRTRSPALAGQHRIRVGGRTVGLVTALLTVEVYHWVRTFTRSSGGGLVVVIDVAEALLSCPCLQQRSIHSEVLIGEQIPLACLLEHSREKSLGNVTFQQTLAILHEHRHIPNRVVHVQANEPTEQQVVIQLLHQHAFAAHGV